MPRMTALQVRNTALKSVSITVCQSSALIRINSPSFVTPALLTRTDGVPSRDSMSLKHASTELAVATSSTVPRPCTPAADRYSSIARAPASLVAVPITRAPRLPSSSAIARPMPRDAPVTNASWSLSMLLLLAQLERRVERFRVLDRDHRQVGSLLDALVQRGQHLAGPAFDDRRDAAREHRAHGVGPTDGPEQLLAQSLADASRARVFLDVDGVDGRHVWQLDFDRCEACRELIGGLDHQPAV